MVLRLRRLVLYFRLRSPSQPLRRKGQQGAGRCAGPARALELEREVCLWGVRKRTRSPNVLKTKRPRPSSAFLHNVTRSLLPRPERGGGGGNVLHVVASLLQDEQRPCSLGWGFGKSLARVLYRESGVCGACSLCGVPRAVYNNTVIHPATADFIECNGMYNGEVSRWAVVLFKRFGAKACCPRSQVAASVHHLLRLLKVGDALCW